MHSGAAGFEPNSEELPLRLKTVFFFPKGQENECSGRFVRSVVKNRVKVRGLEGNGNSEDTVSRPQRPLGAKLFRR